MSRRVTVPLLAACLVLLTALLTLNQWRRRSELSAAKTDELRIRQTQPPAVASPSLITDPQEPPSAGAPPVRGAAGPFLHSADVAQLGLSPVQHSRLEEAAGEALRRLMEKIAHAGDVRTVASNTRQLRVLLPAADSAQLQQSFETTFRTIVGDTGSAEEREKVLARIQAKLLNFGRFATVVEFQSDTAEFSRGRFFQYTAASDGHHATDRGVMQKTAIGGTWDRQYLLAFYGPVADRLLAGR
jgi:hypothetical protein